MELACKTVTVACNVVWNVCEAVAKNQFCVIRLKFRLRTKLKSTQQEMGDGSCYLATNGLHPNRSLSWNLSLTERTRHTAAIESDSVGKIPWNNCIHNW